MLNCNHISDGEDVSANSISFAQEKSWTTIMAKLAEQSPPASNAPMVPTEDPDRLLASIDEMQLAFLEAFRHRPEFLTAHSWNVCVRFWRLRHDDQPIEKTVALAWRKPDGGNAIVGENKAREHLDLLIQDGFVEEYHIPEINKRIKFVRPSNKLLESFTKILNAGVGAVRHYFEIDQLSR